MPAPATLKKAESALRDYGLTFPEATEDHPWGHLALKVKGKAFAFLGVDDGTFHISAKLPISHESALMLPFAEPTGYGLGKAGWVSAGFKQGEQVPLDLLKAWIDESYRAIAPKKLSARLDGAPAPRPAKPAKARPGR